MKRLTKKQSDVYNYILEYHAQYNCPPTQKEIKEHFGLKSFGSVQRYLKYLNDAGMIDLNWNQRRGMTLTPGTDHSQSNDCALPLLGEIAAGEPILAFEDKSEMINVPHSLINPAHLSFVLKVKGDSMIEKGILAGDYLILKKTNQAAQGDIVAAYINEETTVKSFYKLKQHIELRPANEAYSPLIIPANSNDDFFILGVVTGLFRQY